MANPRNVVIMTGWIASDVKFISDQEGREFQARFLLKVQRNYKNKEGHYESDFFQVRMNGSEGRLNLAKKIKNGDAVTITGDFRNEQFELKGKQYYMTFLNVDSFVWTPLNSLNKEEIFEIQGKSVNATNTTAKNDKKQTVEKSIPSKNENDEVDIPFLDGNSIRNLCQELPFQ